MDVPLRKGDCEQEKDSHNERLNPTHSFRRFTGAKYSQLAIFTRGRVHRRLRPSMSGSEWKLNNPKNK